jgi:aspartate racemase
MKKIGIVGGVAWLSTVEYYSELCRRSEELWLRSGRAGPPAYPELTIESLDLNRTVFYLGTHVDEKSWRQFDDYHRVALQHLETSGADFALMACNTAHHRFTSIVRGIGIPVINIFHETAKECARLGATEVLILGTGLTMGSAVFRDAFAKHGIEASGPDDEAARAATVELISQLQLGRRDGAADRVHTIAKRAFERRFKGRPVVCLACTELPLAFPEQNKLSSFESEGVLYVNTAAVHINAAFHFAVSDQETAPSVTS